MLKWTSFIAQWILRSPRLKAVAPVIHKIFEQGPDESASRRDDLWSTREDWVKGEIEFGGRAKLISSWLLALLWNACLLLIASLLVERVPKPILPWLLFAFSVAGSLAFFSAVRASIRHRKYGRSTFKMLAVPGQIGGSLAGLIEVGGKLHPRDGFRLSLSCVQRSEAAIGKNDLINDAVLWEEKKVVNQMQELDLRHSGIPVLFEIPNDCSATSNVQGISWHLQAEADVSGEDFKATFEVPIFRTTVPQQISRAQFSTRYELPLGLENDLAAAGITFRSTFEGKEIDFARGRTKMLGAITLCCFFVAATVVGFLFNRPTGFPYVSLATTLLLGWASVELWLKRLRIVANPSGLTLHKDYPGKRITRNIPASAISSIETKIHAQSSKVTYYYIQACAAGKEISLGGWIKGKKEADWIVNTLYSALQLTTHEENRTTES